jgi:S-adenosylmethionine:diacylglycerol 3-amino-3-carboxypropyl transferase
MNLLQNQSSISKTSKIIFILFIHHHHPILLWLKLIMVSQLSTKSGLENINRLDEEARTSQEKNVFLSRHKRTHLRAFQTRE